MVLGETCKMAATSADRRKVATLGARRGDWCCIGTSLDALGARGRVTAPGPALQNLALAPCAGLMSSRRSLAWSAGGPWSAALVSRSDTLGSRGLLSH